MVVRKNPNRSVLPAAGKPYFDGPNNEWEIDKKLLPDIGNPLVDPQIPNQTIKFAIVKRRDGKTEDANRGFSTSDFEDLFLPEKNPPDIIVGNKDGSSTLSNPMDYFKDERIRRSIGSNIELFYSLEAENMNIGKNIAFSGTFNIQGIYFAHNAFPSHIEALFFVGAEAVAKLREPANNSIPNGGNGWKRVPSKTPLDD